ncbi:MAG TPA: nucleotidyltransferase [Verrucomicrobiales bacterium]|nr:nucleotidyltransferase [Verrucomicrobiales bacterium]
MNIYEDTFISWSRGPSETEAAKCVNAETAVRKAIEAASDLQDLDISVFAQGSYRSRTNVRLNSDVDICIRYNGSFYSDYPAGTTKETFGNVAGTLPFSHFKNMVQTALENRFGKEGVTRGSKAFDIHANSYRIDADVVPTFEHRRYTGRSNPDGTPHYYSGVAFQPDNGALVKNWPKHVYDNGVSRNTETGRSYKRVVRIMKRLRDKMQAERVTEAAGISSFLIECLVFNAPVVIFDHDDYTGIIRDLIINVWQATKTPETCSDWVEISRLKYLFRNTQPWTHAQAHAFLQAAWNHIGYK